MLVYSKILIELYSFTLFRYLVTLKSVEAVLMRLIDPSSVSCAMCLILFVRCLLFCHYSVHYLLHVDCCSNVGLQYHAVLIDADGLQ